MHEISLMQTILDTAQQQALAQGATQIHRIRLQVGAMAGVVPEALEFAFAVLTPDSMAVGGQLQVESLPVICFCKVCGQDFQPQDWIYECPHCHQLSRDIRQGQELILAGLEVS